jgi:Flp pilus assembly protein TadD
MPSDPSLLDSLGWVQYRAGSTHRGGELMEAAVKGMPDEPRPHYHLAIFYLGERKLALARAELQAAADSQLPFPERLDALRLLREISPGTASAVPAGQ